MSISNNTAAFLFPRSIALSHCEPHRAAADAFAVVEALGLKNVVHVGHSTGGGEVARYVAKHGEPAGRVAKAVLVSAVPPLMLKTEANPEGLPMEVFDGFRSALAANRAQFFRDVPAGPFYGFNRDGAKAQEGVIQNWWRQGHEHIDRPADRISERASEHSRSSPLSRGPT